MILRLLTIAFFLNLISSSGFSQRLSYLGNDTVQTAISNLRKLEKSFGYNDYSLVEPLIQLANIQTNIGSYGEANRSIDRAIQLIRRNGGLYTRDQLPYLRQKIENLAASGDWRNARSQMEHVNWFYLSKSKVSDVSLVSDLLHLSSMHLRGINEDLEVFQAYHFRNAMNLQWSALRAARINYGEKDERLVPIMYDLIKHYHLQRMAVEGGGSLGYQLRQYFPGSEWIRGRAETKNYFYYMGRRLLNQIASIYSQSDDYSGNFEHGLFVKNNKSNYKKGKVNIGKHTIIGSGSVILPNISIVNNSSIGALTLVNKDIRIAGIYAGIPCKKIKKK